MRKLYILLTLFFTLFTTAGFSQDIQVIIHQTNLYGPLGEEIVFDFEVINISDANQVVFEVRTINDLPHQDWISSLCFGDNCFSPQVDSIATLPEFFTDELAPGDTLITSLHVTSSTVDGSAFVQIELGTFRNPDDRITLDFVATTILSDVKDGQPVNNYSLMQNYPNPFNPSTNIGFSLKSSSHVSLKVYNLLGEEVASLLNRNMNAGTHTVNFNALNLNSGVYFYKLEAKGTDGSSFRSVKKMILTK